ncbi:MAG: cadmium-translocating P-type ATPase [Treponema sp.]|nr:cadmium-translocating P-type ATPase [Treponema sp.]
MEHEHNHEHEHEHECCGHGHCECGHEEEMGLKKIIAGFVFFVLGLAAEHIDLFALPESFFEGLKVSDPALFFHDAGIVLYLIAFLLCGRNVVLSAVRNILKGKIFDEQFLMTAASAGAFCLGEFAEAVAIMLFYDVGEYFQDYAVDRTRDSISSLMKIRPDHAALVKDGSVVQVPPEEVAAGDVIEVRPGERIPLDGEVISGSSFADTSMLTGESVPRRIEEGSTVLAGFVNAQGVIRVRVTKICSESAITRILKLTEQAADVKAKSEKFITKFAKYYTPVVCILAVLVAVIPPLAVKVFMPELSAANGFDKWVYRALMFLVVSCPCALVISVPLSFFSGIGRAGRQGILIKGSSFIEVLSKADTAVFDKTGTLTRGIFSVSKVVPAEGFDEDELVALAAHAEYFSNHPISKSIRTEHKNRSPDTGCCEQTVKEQAQEIAGRGVRIVLDGKTVLAGNEHLMKEEGIDVSVLPQKKCAGTVVHVAVDGRYAGYIVISDEVKQNSYEAVRELKKLGIKETIMLTGDNEETAALIAADLGIDTVFAGLLPEDKVSRIEDVIESKNEPGTKSSGTVIFVGDGINDSPVLARADAGVAMGAMGSDAAIEAADVVIMDDNPAKLRDAVKISRKTMRIVRENIVLSIGVKVAVMAAGTAGFTNMWTAVFADVGVCFIAILNAIRAMKK